MIADVRKNPGLLKLELFCRGLRIDPACRLEGYRAIHRTRAGLASGLEMILPHGLYVNAPVNEQWVASTPYTLRQGEQGFYIVKDDQMVSPVLLPRQPAFYNKRTSSGRLMSRVAVMQGTYLAVYPARVCHYWEEIPRVNCKFCSVGLNLGREEDEEKSVQDVVEVTKAARQEEGITFVHFNTGYYEGDAYLDILEPYIKAVKEETGLLIGVQTPPHPDFSRYDRLRALGVNNVSFCFEIWDKEIFQRICPGKAAHVGQQRYLDAIAYCAKLFDTTNGEIVAGLEPPEKSIEAIDWITSVGAVPTVCVFRPLTGTDFENMPPPKTEEMMPIFRRLYEKCMEHNLPIGIAPNVKVSIVILPEEGRYFCEDTSRYRWQRFKLGAAKHLFGLGFKLSLTARHVWKRRY